MITTGALGWRSVAKRWRKHLPNRLGQEPVFLEVQDFEGLEALTPYLSRLAWLRAMLRGRRAARAAIAKGCDTILLCTNVDAPLLPLRENVRYFIYGDATARQLGELYYGDTKDSARKRWIRRRLAGIASNGHSFLCMSNWYRAGVLADYGPEPEQAILLPPLVDTDLWRPPTAQDFGQPLQALFVGGDFERKGGDIILGLATKFPQIEWAIVTQAHSASAVRPNVHFHSGMSPDSTELIALAQSCHLMVLPTRADCSPNAILEACAAGLPVIATNIGGICDMIEPGITGELIESAEAELFEKALLGYLKDPSKLERHGAEARIKVEHANSIDAHMATLVNALSGSASPGKAIQPLCPAPRRTARSA